MRMRASTLAKVLALVAVGVIAASPAFAAGFGIFEQGAKATGMAGAFTAQADDPSAMFFNAGGLAFQHKRQFQVGFTWIRSTKADFQGAAPFPGPGVNASLKTLSEFPPHLYWTEPLGGNLTFGLGIETPFGLTTEWQNPNTFPGRFISTKAALRVFDINPTLGFQVSDKLGIGIGVIARYSDVELIQHIPQVNPFTLAAADVATVKLDSNFDSGYGANVGFLYKANEFFSWGLSYRSKVKVDYTGDARFTQNLTGNPEFDAAVAQVIPFDQKLGVKTSIDFPDQASLGFALQLTQRLLVETDINWTGWSSFDVLPIDFSVDQFDTERVEKWKDAYNYRVGLSLDQAGGNQWRFGLLYDKTPQPEEAISPLLPDANRKGVTVGYGFRGQSSTWDLSVTYLDFDKAKRNKSFPGEGPFFGEYQTRAVLVGFTVGF